MKNLRVKRLINNKGLISNIEKILNFFIPNGLIYFLMERYYTDFGLEVSNACNANCSFCAYRFMERKLKVTRTEDIKKIIDEYSFNGGGDVNFTPVVGDPLVDKNLLKKIKYCRSKKNIKHIWTYTNGLYLNRFDVREFIQCGITRLSISTYLGDEEKYFKYYGSKNYRQIIENIKNITKMNNDLGQLVKIQLHLRVELPEELWKDNSDFIEIKNLVGEKNITFLDTYESWSGQIKESDIPKGTKMSNTNVNLNVKIKSPCFEMYRRVQILSNGDVGVCVCRDIEGEINIGDINKESLEKIWRGDKLKNYRNNWTEGNIPSVCVSCDRYRPVDDYVKKNAFLIFTKHMKRYFNRTKKRLLN